MDWMGYFDVRGIQKWDAARSQAQSIRGLSVQ